MPITVATLAKKLIAVPAGEGSTTLVGARVVKHVAELVEGLAALEADQQLVEAACLLISSLLLSVDGSLFRSFLDPVTALSSWGAFFGGWFDSRT